MSASGPRLLLATVLLLGSWIHADDWWPPAGATDAGLPRQILLDAPTAVLDGTDLVEVEELPGAELPTVLEGTY